MDLSNVTLGSVLGALVVSGGGGAAIGVGLFKVFGAKWLDSRFDERLQKLRHDHDREIEELRFRISSLLDRSNRLTAREFEVLPEAWTLVFEAHVQVASVLTRLRRMPDLERASMAVLQDVLERTDFAAWEKEELRALPVKDRNAYFWKHTEAHAIYQAKTSVRDASNYLAKKGLFLESEVQRRLKAFADDAWQAVVTFELLAEMRGIESPPENAERHDETYRQSAESKIDELERFIRDRFWAKERNAGMLAPKAVKPDGPG